MAGTAPTDFGFTTTPDAGPVHCSVWLCGLGERDEVSIGIFDSELTHSIVHHFRTPREFNLASQLGGKRFNVIWVDVKCAAAYG